MTLKHGIRKDCLFRMCITKIEKEFREQLFGEILNVYHEKKAEKIKEAKDKAVQESREIPHHKENAPFRYIF